MSWKYSNFFGKSKGKRATLSSIFVFGYGHLLSFHVIIHCNNLNDCLHKHIFINNCQIDNAN